MANIECEYLLVEFILMIGVFSDAHGNIGGFRSAVRLMRTLGVDSYYYLGDSVGYIPSLEVVEELQRMGDTVKCILGNHEEILLGTTVDLDRELVYQHEPLRCRLNVEHIKFLRSWPEFRQVCVGETRLLMVHGGPKNHVNQYVYPDTDLAQFTVSESFIFMGHSHRPFIKIQGGTTFINVGSCGLPRDDGRYGSFVIFDPIQCNAKLYRYDIRGSLDVQPVAIRRTIHPTITQLFDRRSHTLTGEILTNPGDDL